MFTETINQCFLTALIADRYLAAKNPFKYNNFQHEYRAYFSLWIIMLLVFPLYLPVFFYSFVKGQLYSLYWFQMEMFPTDPISFDLYISLIYRVISYFFVLVQILLGFLLISLFKNMKKSTNKNRALIERRKEEKSKILLLVGTNGLNIVCMTVFSVVDLLEFASEKQHLRIVSFSLLTFLLYCISILSFFRFLMVRVLQSFTYFLPNATAKRFIRQLQALVVLRLCDKTLLVRTRDKTITFQSISFAYGC